MISICNCKQKVFVSFLLVVLLSIIGCAAKIPADRMIQLTEGAATQGSYKTGEVTVAYTFNRTGDTMTVNGMVSHYGGLDSLNVFILFSDANSQVLQRNLVYSTGYRTGHKYRGGGNFEERLTVPPEAVGFVFSYSGKSRQSSR